MASYYSISHSPRRLAERRGIPQLQPLEPAYEAKSIIASRISSENDIYTPQSVTSSIPSSRYSPDGFNSSQMSTPATPTDFSPFRSSAIDTFSPVTAPPSIREEEEEDQECNCDCGGYTEGPRMRGLGFEVNGLSKQTSAMRLSERLHVATGSSQPLNYEYPSQFDANDKGQFPMPPTPPSQAGERPYAYPENRSPILRTQKSDELIIDPECFTSAPPSAPQSPASESSGRSRAATILNKVVPYKLRASFKRRLSSPNTSQNQVPPVPAASTMPNHFTPGTPPEDIFDDFFRKHDDALKSSKAEDSASIYSNGEIPLPPLLHPAATFSEDMELHVASPVQSPRYMMAPSFFGADVFPEMCGSPIPSELVSSPLHPPTISPLMSPSLASASQTSLNIISTQPASSHRKVPSIDPATPLASMRPSAPATPVTADSLADMIEEMNADLSAYDATRDLMIESGWSSSQEIRNVELQREEKEKSWKMRIAESKKILEHMRRSEVKNYAMSSVSSIHSLESTMTSNGSTSEPMTYVPVTVLPVTDSQSLRSLKGSERTLSR